jgi:hypothetical protein
MSHASSRQLAVVVVAAVLLCVAFGVPASRAVTARVAARGR